MTKACFFSGMHCRQDCVLNIDGKCEMLETGKAIESIALNMQKIATSLAVLAEATKYPVKYEEIKKQTVSRHGA